MHNPLIKLFRSKIYTALLLLILVLFIGILGWCLIWWLSNFWRFFQGSYRLHVHHTIWWYCHSIFIPFIIIYFGEGFIWVWAIGSLLPRLLSSLICKSEFEVYYHTYCSHPNALYNKTDSNSYSSYWPHYSNQQYSMIWLH